MSMPPTAFLLLTLPNATLKTPTTSSSGRLSLESVSLTNGLNSSINAPANAYLVLRVDTLELPIDPAGPISLAISQRARTYTFQTPDPEASSSVTTLIIENDPRHAEDIETLDAILAQYAEFTWDTSEGHVDVCSSDPVPAEGLRGRLVLMDEASGEVVAEVPHQAPITEDPALAQQDQKQGAGSLDEKAGPVVLELPPDAYDAHTTTGAELLEARQLFVRAVPPEEQDWIMKSAMLFSRAIDSSTSLILTGVTSASTYYINHSTPAPYAPDSNSSPPSSAESAPNPPRVLQALTSPQAHAALAQAHTFSGQAVRVSQRTVELVEGMIRRAVGGQPTPARSPRQVGSGIEGNGKAPQPSTPPPPPPYTPPYAPRLRKTNMEEKPGLPPRHTPVVAGIPPPLPPRSPQPSASSLSDPPLAATESAEHHPNQRLHKGAQLVLSANLVLAALDDSVRRMWDGSSASLNAVVQHKYGSAAAHSTHLASHTARNVVLVYIDMRGFARRALIKKAGTQWVRGQVAKAGKSKGPSTLGDSKA